MRDLIKDAPLIDRDRKEKRRKKAQLPVGIELGTSRFVVQCATTWATTTANFALMLKPMNNIQQNDIISH